MRRIKVHDVELAWDEMGSGDSPVLVVPQWFLSSRSVRVSPLVAELARRHRIVLYDRRGTGASDKPGPPYSTGRDARDLAALIEGLGLDGLTLLGLGVRGSQVALNYAGHFPGHVRRLVLIGGTPKWSASAEWPYGVPAGTWHSAFAAWQQSLGEPPGLPENDPTMADAMRADWRDTGVDAAIDMLNRTLDEDLRPFLKKVVAPTLVVHLRKDPLVSLEAAQWLADSLAAGTLAVFDAPREVPMRSPAGVAAMIEEFLISN